MSLLRHVAAGLMFVCMVRSGVCLGAMEESTCLSRFDYDYKMMKTVLDLERTLVDLQKTVSREQERIKQLESLQGRQGATVESIKGDFADLKRQRTISKSQYIRWGRTTCPMNGTELVYTGHSAGSHYNNEGSSANYLCLPQEPLWGLYQDETQTQRALVFGSEYESEPTAPALGPLDDEDAPCSVCVTQRHVVMMIPGRNRCYPGWTVEYRGYLVGGKTGNVASAEFVCMDEQAEPGPPERSKNHNGNIFYMAEVRCGSLPCPPYVDGRELTCVVCSK